MSHRQGLTLIMTPTYEDLCKMYKNNMSAQISPSRVYKKIKHEMEKEYMFGVVITLEVIGIIISRHHKLEYFIRSLGLSRAEAMREDIKIIFDYEFAGRERKMSIFSRALHRLLLRNPRPNPLPDILPERPQRRLELRPRDVQDERSPKGGLEIHEARLSLEREPQTPSKGVSVREPQEALASSPRRVMGTDGNLSKIHPMGHRIEAARRLIVQPEVRIMLPEALYSAFIGKSKQKFMNDKRIDTFGANIFPGTSYIETFVGHYPVTFEMDWKNRKIEGAITHFSDFETPPQHCVEYSRVIKGSLEAWARLQDKRADGFDAHSVDLRGFRTSVSIHHCDPHKYLSILASWSEEQHEGFEADCALLFTLSKHVDCGIENHSNIRDVMESSWQDEFADEIWVQAVQCKK